MGDGRDDLDVRQPRWTGVFLVCKACGKRSNGAKRLKPKEVVGLVRKESKKIGERVRVVMTGCLGLCPQSAVALAHAGAGSPTRIMAVESAKQAKAAVARLATGDRPRPG